MLTGIVLLAISAFCFGQYLEHRIRKEEKRLGYREISRAMPLGQKQIQPHTLSIVQTEEGKLSIPPETGWDPVRD